MSKNNYDRNTFFVEIGGVLWWIFIRFCKTELKTEQSKKYEARNVLFIFVFIFIISLIKIKFFE